MSDGGCEVLEGHGSINGDSRLFVRTADAADRHVLGRLPVAGAVGSRQRFVQVVHDTGATRPASGAGGDARKGFASRAAGVRGTVRRLWRSLMLVLSAATVIGAVVAVMWAETLRL